MQHSSGADLRHSPHLTATIPVMTVQWLERDGTRIVAELRIASADPEHVWRLWTEPDELSRWWPDEADVDLDVRTLHLAWPRMEWHLRGRILELEPPRRLSFTWNWDHEPGLPERTVTIDLARVAEAAGTELRLTHGDYGDGDVEAADRQSHIDGWDFFLPRLAAAATAER
jgi:uncharacterized protein YndB with AHSA1/START domain